MNSVQSRSLSKGVQSDAGVLSKRGNILQIATLEIMLFSSRANLLYHNISSPAQFIFNQRKA